MPEKIAEDTKRVNVILTKAQLRRLDAWRREQLDLPNMSLAIRQMLDIGLDSVATPKRKSHRAA